MICMSCDGKATMGLPRGEIEHLLNSRCVRTNGDTTRPFGSGYQFTDAEFLIDGGALGIGACVPTTGWHHLSTIRRRR